MSSAEPITPEIVSSMLRIQRQHYFLRRSSLAGLIHKTLRIADQFERQLINDVYCPAQLIKLANHNDLVGMRTDEVEREQLVLSAIIQLAHVANNFMGELQDKHIAIVTRINAHIDRLHAANAALQGIAAAAISVLEDTTSEGDTDLDAGSLADDEMSESDD